jgi:DNA polymerase III subunit beta
MKLTILQENINKGLSIVGKFIKSKPQLPILENILFSAEKGKLKLSATNLETGINLNLPAKIEKEGKITIPSRIIVDFISSLPQDKVNLELEKERLNVFCRNYKASFNGISATEYPAIPTKETLKKTKRIKIKAKSLINAIDQVAFTASQDESRPILTGVKLDFADSISLAATDGYRLSLKKIKLKQKIDLKTLIIPAAALVELARIYLQEKDQEDIVLIKDAGQIIFAIKNIEIITRLLEGEYPDFEKIIPKESKTKIITDKEELNKAVKTASILAKDSANIIKFKINKNSLEIKADAPEVGENKTNLDIKKEGEDVEIAFNYRFLQEYLNTVNFKEVEINLSGSLKPGIFKNPNKKSFLHIIMPVRIKD